jgi:GNAT superfamily N-acetyltransferase
MTLSSRIRLATLQDADLLPAIERCAAKSFRTIDSFSWLAEASVMSVAEHRAVIVQSTCWVAVDAQNQPVGFLSAQRQDFDLHVHELSVRQDCQAQGLGRELIQAAVRWATGQALRAVTLTTFRDVPWNQPFYTRLGFETLADENLSVRLLQILENEGDRGFSPSQRCAMARVL